MMMADAKPVMTRCNKFENGMVIAFDQRGDQMPEYQGRYDAVVDRIKTDFPNIVIQGGRFVDDP